jgi:SAM-dependent methyltransferase
MNFSQLMASASGHAEARILQSAVSLGVFDTLEGSPQTAEAVANSLKLDAQATELLLNALSALNILQKHGSSFSLAESVKPYLLRSSPRYLGGMILFEDLSWRYWEKLPDAIRTGKPARAANMYQEHPRETEIFINAMDSLVKARGDTEALASALEWADVESFLDIGSGPATYPIALCRRFPRIRATIFDLPGTLKITDRYVRQAQLAERITLISGDYRKDPIPGQFDVIFLSNIIHGEDYSGNRALIAKLTGNLKSAGRIVIKDHILDDSRTHPPVGAIFSLLMLLTTDGGRCYSFREIKNWMQLAGLKEVRQIDLPPPLTSSLVIGSQ